MKKEEWLKRFSYALQSKMCQKEILPRDLAKITGLSDRSIIYYLAGECVPSVRAVINIAHALDCTIADLVDFGERIY